MKNFIKKIIILIVIAIIFNQLLSAFLPYYWGNTWYASKVSIIKDQEIKPNVYFFGSSRVCRQIDPIIFDSIINTNMNCKLKSFNLGSPATFCPQTYYLYEHFINSELSENVKYCFVEITGIAPINDFLFHQERTNYWIGGEEALSVSRYFLSQDNNIVVKFDYISRYWISFFENTFHIGHFGEFLTNNDYYSNQYAGINQNGFLSLETDLHTSTNSVVVDNLKQRNQTFLEDTTTLTTRLQEAKTIYSSIEDSRDDLYLNILNDLILLSENNGIHLIYFVTPRSVNQDIINLFNELPDMNKIDMANPYKYPEFYYAENSFDVGHLNDKGSILHTENFANEFLQMMKYSNLAN